MALSGYEKQKRWREKNRALYNFQQRQRRKKGGDATCLHQQSDSANAAAASTEFTKVGVLPQGNAAPKVQSSDAASFTTKKVGEFRMVVIPKSDEPVATESKPLVYRNDYGNIITERQWKTLQKKKEDARAGGYVLDEYSQG